MYREAILWPHSRAEEVARIIQQIPIPFVFKGMLVDNSEQNSSNTHQTQLSPRPPMPPRKKEILNNFRKRSYFEVGEEIERREFPWGHTSGSLPSSDTCASKKMTIPKALQNNRIWKIFMRLHLSCSTQHILQSDMFVIFNTLVNHVAQQPWEWRAYLYIHVHLSSHVCVC